MRSFPLLVLALGTLPLFYFQSVYATDSSAPPETKMALVFTGGHDTDPRDRGRPVVLIAAALGVPAAVFRDAFSHVHPAPAGEQPAPAQVRLNKDALMQRFAPYGVTNERLDEVSNYYRYRRQNGELWRHVDAAGYVVVGPEDRVIRVVVINPGSGYTTPPDVEVSGTLNFGSSFCANLLFGTHLDQNGSILSIKAVPRPVY
jgi:hypothetical protein